MRKIRVMHLVHQLGSGGAENGIVNLANHMDTKRFEKSICAFVGNGVLTSRLDLNRVALFEMGKVAGNDFRLLAKLFPLFKRWGPDIVHTHAWGTLCEGFLAGKAARVPVLVHGEHGTIQEKKRNVLVQRIFWGFADKVLSVSRVHACKISKSMGFPLKKIEVIANGVDSDLFRLRDDRRAIRDELGLGADDIVLGTVGRLVPVKNQEFLIRSFARLVGDGSRAKLVVAGDGPLRGELESEAEKQGCLASVRFLGRRSDIPDVMAALDIFALTSVSEGMSNTILEAMGSGLPVVATDVGGNPELVVNNETGFLIPSNNVGALASALKNLVENPVLRLQMGQAGRARVERKFSLGAMVANYERLYLRLLTEKGCKFQ